MDGLNVTVGDNVPPAPTPSNGAGVAGMDDPGIEGGFVVVVIDDDVMGASVLVMMEPLSSPGPPNSVVWAKTIIDPGGSIAVPTMNVMIANPMHSLR